MTTNTLLYNKYRPLKFSEVAGNKETSDILRGLIRNNQVRNTHFILAGSAGSGKTTTARILARAINCLNPQDGEPCNECEHCKKFLAGAYVDYKELDGTSYNKVEDAKRLIEIATQYPLVKNHYRVIMIDEAHRLSNAAWDKFLILLESADVKTIFIFATTDIHLFRPAIISRCFTFYIKPLVARDIAQEALRICRGEGISYSMDAINKLAYNYQGKPRDAIKTLDMIIRSTNSFLEYNKESIEQSLLQCFKLAYFNKFEEYLPIVERLDVSKIYNNLTTMISEVFLYPKVQPILIEARQIEEFKNLIDSNAFKQIINDTLLYKPNDINSLILLLAQVSALGIKLQAKQEQTSQHRGRRFVEKSSTQRQISVAVDIDSEVTAPTKQEQPQAGLDSSTIVQPNLTATNIQPQVKVQQTLTTADLEKFGFIKVS